MTPDEVILMARRRYNAVGDNLWSDAELYDIIYQACLEACGEEYAVRRIYTTSTVAGTQGYDFPTNTIAIKRVTWGGKKLTPIDMREDDAVTALNQDTTSQGDPQYYWTWNRTIYLRPIPSSVATLKLWTYNQQGEISTGTTEIELPSEHHGRLVQPLLSAMAAKDQNLELAKWYLDRWTLEKIEIRKALARNKRTDGFTTVKDENMIVATVIGGA